MRWWGFFFLPVLVREIKVIGINGLNSKWAVADGKVEICFGFYKRRIKSFEKVQNTRNKFYFFLYKSALVLKKIHSICL